MSSLRIRARRAEWINPGGGLDSRLRLTLQLVQQMYDENAVALPDDADLTFITDDFPADAYDEPVLTWSARRGAACVNIHLVPCCHTAGWPDARMVSVFDLPATVENAPAFADRRPCAFWIGNTDRHPVRGEMARAHADNPKIRFVPMYWHGGVPTPFKTMREHCEYKYLMDIQGTGWSGRLKHLMLLGSVVLIFDRDLHEYWEDQFVPWVHYVPVKADGSDLQQRVDFLDANPDRAAEMARVCNARARDVFSKPAVHEYYASVIRKLTWPCCDTRPLRHADAVACRGG